MTTQIAAHPITKIASNATCDHARSVSALTGGGGAGPIEAPQAGQKRHGPCAVCAKRGATQARHVPQSTGAGVTDSPCREATRLGADFHH